MPSHAGPPSPHPHPFRHYTQRALLGLLLLVMAGCGGQCSLTRFDYTRYGELLAEADCNVEDDLLIEYCPDCSYLPLRNPTFGWGSGENRTPWRGDRAVIVEGVTANVTPCTANRMLRFEATYETDPNEQDAASTVYQLIDLRDTPFTGAVTFIARALVNRWRFDDETDRVFQLSLTAYAGDPTTFERNSPAHQQLASNTETLVADARNESWSALFTELTVPSLSDPDFLLVAIVAVEDLVDDPGTATEFDAQFVDKVQVGYTTTEHDLGLQLQARPNRTSRGGKVVYGLTFTNHTPEQAILRARVATMIDNRRITISNAQGQNLSQQYLAHTGDGIYDPDSGIWHLDGSNNSQPATLYIAMETTGAIYEADSPWYVHASILGNPGDGNAGNDRDTVRVSPSFHFPTGTVPDLVLTDITMSVGDTITTPLFTESNASFSSVSAHLSRPGIAQVRYSNTVENNLRQHSMNIVALAEGQSTVIVTVNAIYPTADFFTLTVLPLDTPPQANDDSYTVTAGQTLTVDAPGVLENDTDADGEMVTAVLETLPGTGALTLNPDGGFTYIPAAGFTGDSFTYRAEDEAQGGVLLSDIATVTLLPEPPNQAPVAVTDALHARLGQDTILDVLANDYDPDGDTFTLNTFGQPLPDTLLVTNNGQLLYRSSGFIGTTSFGYSIIDEHGATSFETEAFVNVNNNPAYDLAVAASVSPDTVTLGLPATFTVTVTNHGPNAAAGVEVSMRIPPMIFAIDSAQPSQGTYATGRWSVGALPAGQSATLTITGTPQQDPPLRDFHFTLRPLIDMGLGGNDDPTNNVAEATLVVII